VMSQELLADKKVSGDDRRGLLFDTADWDFQTIQRTYDAIEDIALNDLGLSVYPNQVEIISSEQMLDAYCSVGMPVMYTHWSFGKRFVAEEAMYRKGYRGLAYEIVINSNPCISYCMEENTMAMQTLVVAHAAFGHNHFFKNNYLFQQWTCAEAILDYFEFAKRYIAECEERHGLRAVEDTLDAAHAVMDQSVFRYRRPSKLKVGEIERRQKERRQHEERTFQDLWRTVPQAKQSKETDEDQKQLEARKAQLKLPEENLLYFIEKQSPVLEPWQREIIRIVRSIAQYFYPQKQTKLMNEGCATFVHYYIVNELYDRGMISEGTLLEILHSHCNVVFQPEFDDPRYSGINPYALGFAMMQDIKRICEQPDAEDREWFPDIAGNNDWRGTLKSIWANYRDESFVNQFLSPRLIRQFKLFVVSDKSADDFVRIDAIHDEAGYRKVRADLAASYDITLGEPDIQIADVDFRGNRELVLRQTVREGVQVDQSDCTEIIKHLRHLWGYDVSLEGISSEDGSSIFKVTTDEAGDQS